MVYIGDLPKLKKNHGTLKFPMLRFSKGCCSLNFHSISTKFYCKYVGREGIQDVTVFGDPRNFKNLCHFEIFVNYQTIWGWKFQNTTPSTVFIRSGPKFTINTAVIGVYKVMDILAICKELKILWHFEVLTY